MKIYKISEIAIVREQNARYAMTAKKALEIVDKEMRYIGDKFAENRDTGELVNVDKVLNENDITHYIFHAVFCDILVNEIEVEE